MGIPLFLRKFPLPIVRLNYQFYDTNSNGKPYSRYGGRSSVDDVRQGYRFTLKRLCGENTKIALFGRCAGVPLALSLVLNSDSALTNHIISAVVLDKDIYNWAALTVATKTSNHAFICCLDSIREHNAEILSLLRTCKAMAAQCHSPINCLDHFVSSRFIFVRKMGISRSSFWKNFPITTPLHNGNI